MKTIDEIRHENLLRVIERLQSIQALADLLGTQHAQISQLKNRNKHSGTGRERVVGDEIARRIEDKLSLERGWMDNVNVPFPGETGREDVTVHDILNNAGKTERRVFLGLTREILTQSGNLGVAERLSQYEVSDETGEGADDARH